MYPYSYGRVYKHDRFRITCCCSSSHWVKRKVRGKKFITTVKKRKHSERYFETSLSFWIAAFKLLLTQCDCIKWNINVPTFIAIRINIYYLYFTLDQTSSVKCKLSIYSATQLYLQQIKLCHKLSNLIVCLWSNGLSQTTRFFSHISK